MIKEQRLKPARDLQIGEIVTAKTGVIQRTVKVLGFPPNRIGAKLVPEFLEDFTPASEYEKARESRPPPQFAWSKGVGRPTKKSRRLWEKWGGEEVSE